MSDESSVGSLVPQLFYDLISRVVPGSVLIPVLLCSWWGPGDFWTRSAVFWSHVSLEHSPGLLLTLAALTLAYFVGVSLRGLWYMLSAAKRLIFGRADSVDIAKYYRIKVELPAAGNRVAKMKAEVSMAEVFFLGFVIGLIVNIWGIARGDMVGRWTLGCVLFLCSLSFAFFGIAVRRRLAASIECHYAMLAMLGNDKQGDR